MYISSTIKTKIAALKLARKAVCCYSCDTYCDCKYGATGIGEQTGCPEIRELIYELESIDVDETYQKSVD